MKTDIKKDTWRVFLLCLLLLFAVFSIMLADRISNDGFSDYVMNVKGTHAAWKMQLGRFSGAAAEAVLHWLGINDVAVQFPFTLALILTMAWCCADVWALEISAFSQPDQRTKDLLLLAVLPAFINISFGEFFFFSNCAIHWIGMLLFAQLALRVFFSKNTMGRKLLSTFLLVLSLGFYQAAVAYFIIWGLLTAVLREDLRADRKTFRSLLEFMIVAAAASILTVALQKLFEVTGLVSGTDRSPGLGTLFYNLFRLATSGQWNVQAKGMHFLGCLMGLTTFSLTIGLYVFVKKAKKSSLWLIILLSLICYGISFLPHALTPTVWLAPRSLFGVFSYISFCAILILYVRQGCTERGGVMHVAFAALLGVFLVANARGIYLIGLEQIRSNITDKTVIYTVEERIEAYEQESGVSVNRIGLIFDSSTWVSNPDIKNTYMDINQRATSVSWQIPASFFYFFERELDSVDVPEDVYREYFDGREWDSFNMEEQIILIDNTLYWGVY
ncbi:MAG: glucosyltransferase domain-containing protein [Oscillospiraceae bacterium]|nr:glucosyltransferase domain-containing protein [Oscillospiraceae bacterium]